MAATQPSCPSCGGTDFTYDGSCGGEMAKCLDCGRLVSTREAAPALLYHRMPDPMVGHILYPLNRLAQVAAEAAAAERGKYAGREQLMAVRLPILDCLWNDVLHLSPVHPAKIKRRLLEVGFDDVPPRRFFVIEPAALRPERAVYFRHSKDTGGRFDFEKSDFLPFEPRRYRELEDVPAEQLLNYRQAKSAGERPLLWSRTPHVFYQGEIDTRGLEVIDW